MIALTKHIRERRAGEGGLLLYPTIYREALRMDAFILPADVIADLYGALVASANFYLEHGQMHVAEHVRGLAFSLLDAPSLETEPTLEISRPCTH